jgi:thioredoxin 1
VLPPPLSESQWDREVSASAVPAATLFWAEWCIPCRTVLPYFEQAAASREGRAFLRTVNVDENPGLARRYAVVGLPTLLLFRGGAEVGRRVGLIPEERLTAILDGLVSSP